MLLFIASDLCCYLKHLPGIQETQFRSLHWEDPLEKEMAAHSSILASWGISGIEGVTRVKPDSETKPPPPDLGLSNSL